MELGEDSKFSPFKSKVFCTAIGSLFSSGIELTNDCLKEWGVAIFLKPDARRAFLKNFATARVVSVPPRLLGNKEAGQQDVPWLEYERHVRRRK